MKVKSKKLTKYRIQKEIIVENLKEFEQDYLDGKLIPTRKSEDIPIENYT